MGKSVSNGEITDNKGTSKVLLRLYRVSLRLRYEPMTIHAGNAKDSQGQLRYTVAQSYDDTVILRIMRAAQRFNTVLVRLCAEALRILTFPLRFDYGLATMCLKSNFSRSQTAVSPNLSQFYRFHHRHLLSVCPGEVLG